MPTTTENIAVQPAAETAVKQTAAVAVDPTPVETVQASVDQLQQHVSTINWLKQEAFRMAAEFHRLEQNVTNDIEEVIATAEKIFSFLHSKTIAKDAAKLHSAIQKEAAKLNS